MLIDLIKADTQKVSKAATPTISELSQVDSRINPTRQFMLRHIGFDKAITHAQGSELFDENENVYCDFISQYGALPFGHNAPNIKSKIVTFLANNEASFVQPLRAQHAELLAQRLIDLSPFQQGYCTFCNSGAESVEIAIKLARSYTGRQVIISSKTGFHGKTLGAGSATGNQQYSAPFLADTQFFEHMNLNELKELEARLAKKDVAALIIELVQGEGGMRLLEPSLVEQLSKLSKKYGTLLVVDEVQTGIGRLGYTFGLEKYPDVEADIICLAKALGGGIVPLGAMICRDKLWTEELGLFHSSTFANNNFTCVVGNAVLDELTANDGEILQHVRDVAKYLKVSLEKVVSDFPFAFKSLQGDGLMLGVELMPWPQSHSYFLAHASFHGLAAPLVCGYLLNCHQILTAPVFNHHSVVRIEPNLIVTKPQIDRLIDALNDVGELITKRKFSSLFAYMIGKPSREVEYTEQDLALDPVMPLPKPSGKKLGSFAFLIHPTMDEDLMRIMPEAINNLHPEHKDLWYSWMDSWFSKRYEPAPVLYAPAVTNSDGDYVEGWLISCPLTPEKMMRLKKEKREFLMQQYFDIAHALNVDRVGLGAFTSIVTRGGTRLPERTVAVTSGNSFTGMMSARGVIEAVNARFSTCNGIRLAVIGAAGAVGRIAAIEASREFREITLFGNPSNPHAIQGLDEIRAEIVWRAFEDEAEFKPNAIARELMSKAEKVINFRSPSFRELLNSTGVEAFRAMTLFIEQRAPGLIESCIRISVSIEEELPNCNAIISATSNGKGFIPSNLLAQESVVCDAARPPDFSGYISQERPDIVAFEGGVVKLPEPIAFGKSNILGFEPDVNLACLSETIILAMAGLEGDYSLGKELDITQAREIYEFGLSFGFKLPTTIVESIEPAAQPHTQFAV